MAWGVATALLDAGREQRASSACSRSTRRGCRAWPRSSTRALSCWPTCSATSSTATASSSCSPTAGPRSSPRHDGRARFVLNADDPLVADLGRERERRHLLRRRGRLARRCPSSSTPPTPSTAATAGTPTSTTRSTSATSAATAARTAAASGPQPQVVAAARRAARAWPARDVVLAHAGRGAIELRFPLPGLYNVYNALAAAAAALELGVAARQRPRGAGGLRRRLRPRRDDPACDGRDVSILLVKNPAGANEVLRTLTLEDGQARPVARAERPHRRRPRRLLGLGRRLRAAGGPRAPGHVLGHPRRGDGAAAEVRGRRRASRWSTATWSARSTPPSPTATTAARCTRSPPTPRCSSCATCWPPRRGRAVVGVSTLTADGR